MLASIARRGGGHKLQPSPSRLHMDDTARARVAAYRGGMMNPARANQQDDLFTTETAGLPEVLGPDVTRLADGDRLDLRIGPVRKRLGGDELRMLAYNGSIPGPVLHVDQGSEITVQVKNDGDLETTVHWHGLRLENQYDGVPFETQAPIPIGGTYTRRSASRTPGSTGTTRTSARTTAWRLGLYGTIIVEPSDPSYWPAGRPAADRHARRPARRGRADRAVPPLRAYLHGHGPIRQRHADQRRDSSSPARPRSAKSCASTW